MLKFRMKNKTHFITLYFKVLQYNIYSIKKTKTKINIKPLPKT